MNWLVSIYIAILFFVLTPGILLSLPPKGSKMVVAATHAIVFALVFHFTGKMVWQASMSMSAPPAVTKETTIPHQH
jgi:high-affinity Fe2+/Pb2+ permease